MSTIEPKSGFINVTGVRLPTLDWGGEGEPIVLVHGYPDSHAVWRPLVELTRLRHLRFRAELAASDAAHHPTASVVTAGV